MTIKKRIKLYLTMWFTISFLLGAVLLYLGIKNSPELLHMVQASKNTFVGPITAMGFEYSENAFPEQFRKEDPYGNERSTVSISYDHKGNIKSFQCELAYVNTVPANSVYYDMEIMAELANFSLEQDKEKILDVIEKIKQDKSSRTSGELEGGGWSIGTNVYKNRENRDESYRYILCSIWKNWESQK